MTKFKAPARLVVVQFAHCVQFVQSEHFLRSEIRGITGSDFFPIKIWILITLF